MLIGIVFLIGLSVMIPASGEMSSPRQQMKQGVSVENIVCNEGLELVIRVNGLPACVKPQTAEKMQKKCKK